MAVLSTPIWQQKGGANMSDAILSFLIAVAGGVTCHYIIKWLDSDDKDN